MVNPQAIATAEQLIAQQQEAHFEYDDLGRRIGKTESQTEAMGGTPYVTSRRFVWQGLRLAHELRNTGVSSYVYSPDAAYTPLARVDSVKLESAEVSQAQAAQAATATPTRLYHFHTDLVGAPMEPTDEAGELAWAGRYKAWGRVEQGEEALQMARTEQPLRYPGAAAAAGVLRIGRAKWLPIRVCSARHSMRCRGLLGPLTHKPA